jgi:hypothetical protein
MLEKLIALFRGNKQVRQSPLIQERLMKILFNPFVEKHYWVVLNPKTRTWEWLEEATEREIVEWEGETIAEWKGESKNG